MISYRCMHPSLAVQQVPNDIYHQEAKALVPNALSWHLEGNLEPREKKTSRSSVCGREIGKFIEANDNS